MTRRWARALLLILSWSCGLMGVFALIAMAFFLPKVLSQQSAVGLNGKPGLPPGALAGIMIATFLIMGFIFIVLPIIWIFFYGSRHVKATCEARNPETSWTDACPLPVLGFCLWLWFCVPMMLIMPLAGHGVAPFFGVFLTGLPGTIFYVVLAALWGYIGWLIYHLNVRGWWFMLIAMLVFTLSGILTYARHDMVEMYRLMNYPAVQIEQMQKSGFLVGNNLSWLTALSVLPFLGYLLFIKKYFRSEPHSAQTEA